MPHQELLTDYKIITIDIKKSEISEFIKDNGLVELNSVWKKETEARSLASMLALRKAMKQFNIKNKNQNIKISQNYKFRKVLI